MAYLSISGAARAAGKDRGTIKRYLASGRLNASKDATGKPQIDTSELMRVFGTLKVNGAPDAASEKPRDSPESTAMLQVVIEALNGQLQAAQEREEWYKAQLEAEQQRSQKLELKLLPSGTGETPQGEVLPHVAVVQGQGEVPASVKAARQGQGWSLGLYSAWGGMFIAVIAIAYMLIFFKKW